MNELVNSMAGLYSYILYGVAKAVQKAKEEEMKKVEVGQVWRTRGAGTSVAVTGVTEKEIKYVVLPSGRFPQDIVCSREEWEAGFEIAPRSELERTAKTRSGLNINSMYGKVGSPPTLPLPQFEPMTGDVTGPSPTRTVGGGDLTIAGGRKGSSPNGPPATPPAVGQVWRDADGTEITIREIDEKGLIVFDVTEGHFCFADEKTMLADGWKLVGDAPKALGMPKKENMLANPKGELLDMPSENVGMKFAPKFEKYYPMKEDHCDACHGTAPERIQITDPRKTGHQRGMILCAGCIASMVGAMERRGV